MSGILGYDVPAELQLECRFFGASLRSPCPAAPREPRGRDADCEMQMVETDTLVIFGGWGAAVSHHVASL